MPWWTLVGLSFMTVGALGFAASASAAPANPEGSCNGYTTVTGGHVNATVRAWQRDEDQERQRDEDQEMYTVRM